MPEHGRDRRVGERRAGLAHLFHYAVHARRHEHPVADAAGDRHRAQAGALADGRTHLGLRRELPLLAASGAERIPGLEPGGCAAERPEQPVEDAAEQVRAQERRQRLAARPGGMTGREAAGVLVRLHGGHVAPDGDGLTGKQVLAELERCRSSRPR